MSDMATSEKAGQSSAALLRAAHKLTADLMQPRAAIYWIDLLASVVIGYGAMAVAVWGQGLPVRVAAGVTSALALYRAVSFIHELTHLRLSTVPGFWTAWNALVGVPLLMPSFFYEGVHTLHHAKTHYGTIRDPEYLPLGRSRLTDIVLFVVISPLAPLFFILRSALIVPLASVVPPLRRVLMERLSSLVINPHFVRPGPTPTVARNWLVLDAVTTLYAWFLLALVITGVLSLGTVAVVLAITAGVSLINQFRTLVAHRWENDDGHDLDAVEQLLDTVNVPPPGWLPMLWAPVGLRYHGLHHFLPGLPYHNLGQAHRRMMQALPGDSPYHATSSPNARAVLVRLLEHQARVSRTGEGAAAAAAQR